MADGFNDSVHEALTDRLESDLDDGCSLGRVFFFLKDATINLIFISKPVSKSDIHASHAWITRRQDICRSLGSRNMGVKIISEGK